MKTIDTNCPVYQHVKSIIRKAKLNDDFRKECAFALYGWQLELYKQSFNGTSRLLQHTQLRAALQACCTRNFTKGIFERLMESAEVYDYDKLNDEQRQRQLFRGVCNHLRELCEERPNSPIGKFTLESLTYETSARVKRLEQRQKKLIAERAERYRVEQNAKLPSEQSEEDKAKSREWLARYKLSKEYRDAKRKIAENIKKHKDPKLARRVRGRSLVAANT